MQFILRNLEAEVQDMSLDAVLSELQAHREVLNSVDRLPLRKKIMYNISVLQCRKIELQRGV
jgi:hypothetical protein